MNLQIACLVVVLSVAAGVYFANPQRLINQAFALLSALVASWVYFFWILTKPWLVDPVPWLRAIAIVGSCSPLLLWWMGHCLLEAKARWRDFIAIGWPWLGFTLGMGALAASEWFIPASSTPAHKLYGPGYRVHTVGMAAALAALAIQALWQMYRVPAPRRTELRVLFLGGSIMALLILVITAVVRLWGIEHMTPHAPLIVLVFYVAMAWIIASQRLLDARYQLLAVMRRSIGFLCAGTLLAWWFREVSAYQPLDITITLGVAGCVVFLVIFEHGSRALLGRVLAGSAEDTARALSRFASEVHGWPAERLAHASAAHIGGLLGCEQAVCYWRNGPEQGLRLLSNFGGWSPPASLSDSDAIVVASQVERAPWRLRTLARPDRAWAEQGDVCVPVLEAGQVTCLLIVSRKRRGLGYSEAEASALQAVMASCSHTLVTRVLLAHENEQRQLTYAGKLAAGIAHNIRSPLGVVRAYLEADPTLGSDQLAELRKVALKGVTRIQTTVGGLSALSRGERFALASHDVRRIAMDVFELERGYLASCRAEAEVIVKGSRSHAMVEPMQLAAALTNLVRNSAEEVAIAPGGGRIRLEIFEEKPRMITLRLSDTGRGLPNYIQEAVFARDLFAKTTKRTGNADRRTGFGIGLHSTMLIVTTGHGGEFEYTDGAFHIRLQAAADC